ncbi:ArsR/SmtB family transcription factor [Gulosibacter faecalis]|jgi:DNA-binding transcriptional ArsR family regulator|uniref:ArsR/SmtB family transcription factor n=1 Tax=Gulosibacter faecalis TaxID=272240 RepID=A0ABW5V374_9MICO|nr:metalloregulator ArsR/SmtB family transcription factor [Gulosibacter faecalis]
MHPDLAVTKAARLFKVLGSESRLRLLRRIREEPATVTALVEATSMSQPLVSQHLRMLREAELVRAVRHGRESVYELADLHVSHLIEDALEHVAEDVG